MKSYKKRNSNSEYDEYYEEEIKEKKKKSSPRRRPTRNWKKSWDQHEIDYDEYDEFYGK